MRENIIFSSLCKNLGYTPTEDQNTALRLIAGFIVENTNDNIFLLTGYAGTGKTSVISSFVKTLEILRMKSVLLAPTGRAAKVLTSYTGNSAYTIHKKIYRQKSSKDGIGKFVLDRNLHKDTFFIVDEASMISNEQVDQSSFGSGFLLDDLIEYVYSGNSCKLMIVGDTAQLPPVGSVLSKALDPDFLGSYGFGIKEFEIRQVVRQSEDSGILMNATKIRFQIAGQSTDIPIIDNSHFKDIIRLGGNDFLEEISGAYDACGIGDTIIVVNSNSMANRYNQGVRNKIFYREEEISTGDLIMIVKNNYFWLKEENNADFIANGDIAEVKRIRKYEEKFGFRFVEMTLFFPDNNLEIDAKVMLDTLKLDTPSLPSARNQEFYQNVITDYPEIKSKKKLHEAVRENPYFNALQIKFAYAVTCHKAQGGQWKRVFIDQGMFNRQDVTIDYLRWFYTAVTRSTEKLFLVNFSDKWFDN
jgi:exodeoxyribonuclease-5